MNNDSQIPGFCTLWVLVVLAGVLGTAHTQAAPTASIPDVTPLLPYAVFGNQYELVNATIVGNVGISNAGQIAYNANVSISGRLDMGIGATAVPSSDEGTDTHDGESGAGGGGMGGGTEPHEGETTVGPGGVSGGIHEGLDLAGPQARVGLVSSALASLTATSPQTIVSGTGRGTNTLGSTNAIDDVQVFNLSALTLTGNRSLTLVGDPGDFFVLNVLDMNVKGHVIIGSLAQAQHTFLNLYDPSGGDLGQVMGGESQFFGTLLVPYDAAQLKGTVSGAVWSGAGTIELMENVTVINVPFDPPAVPDAGSTSFLLVLGSSVVLVLKRLIRFA